MSALRGLRQPSGARRGPANSGGLSGELEAQGGFRGRRQPGGQRAIEISGASASAELQRASPGAARPAHSGLSFRWRSRRKTRACLGRV
eukprot:9476645-Pyramimonas_sp.AAC.3